MRALRYQALGPVLSGAGSRAFLGLEIFEGEARPIVLVWVPERIAQDPDKVEALDRETRFASKLDHPNILRVHGLARMEEGLARVVEFADGEPLSYILQRSGALPPPFAGRIIADAALGVHYAHSAGEGGRPLLHGDLRPGTLMLSYAGLTKVSGYGAVTLVTEDLKERATEERRTRIAPEQIHGQLLSPQTDVYLLALSLYECLVGGVPFADADAFRASMLHGEVPALRLDDLPSSLVPVLRKATAKNPEERYATALELREAIDECAGPLPTHNDLSRFLNELMKDDERRSARQRELDAGIADFAKKQWQRRGNRRYSDEITAAGQLVVPNLKELREAAANADRPAPRPPEPARAPPPIPSPAEVRTSPAVVSPPAVRTSPSVVAPPRPRQSAPAANPPGVISGGAAAQAPLPPASEPVAAPPVAAVPAAAVAAPRSGPNWTAISILALAVALVAVAAMMRFGGGTPAQPAEVVPPAVAPVAVEAAPARVQPAPVARAPVAEAPVEAPVPVESPPVRQAPPGPVEFKLTVQPAVNVAINGKPMGRSPVVASLAPGKHKVSLTDSAKGIDVTRTVTVSRSGTSEEIQLEMGSVTVEAPDGAEVSVDGKVVGKTPLTKEISIYEGNHRISVMLDKAKWAQKFSVRPGENMHFTVNYQ